MVKINNGVITNLILIAIAILVLTDWFSYLVKKFGSKKIIIIFLIVTNISFLINVPIYNEMKINIGGYIIPFFIFLYEFKRIDFKEKINLLTAVLLLGASYFFMKEIFRLDPIMLLMNEVYQIAILMVITVMIVTSKLNHRITLLIGGTLLGEFLFNLHHLDSFYNITLGNGEFRDILSIAIIEVVLVHYFFIQVKKIFKNERFKFIKLGDHNE